jgi:hypothetical protein
MRNARSLLPLLALVTFAAPAIAACKDDPKPDTTTSKHVAPDPSQWVKDLGGNNPTVEPSEVKIPAAATSSLPVASASASGAPASSSAAPVASGSAAPKANRPHQELGAVKLVEPGAEPRHKLRYKWKANQKETLVVEMKKRVSAEAGPEKQPEQALPTTKYTITTEGKSVSPEGDLAYGFTLESVDIAGDGMNPQMLAAIKKELDSIKGTQGQGVISSRGIVKDAGFKLEQRPKSDVTMQLLQQISITVRDLVPPLPEEDVGKGGKWERSSLQDVGAKVNQKETYTLKDMQGDLLTLDVLTVQSAGAQPFQGGPPGANVKMESATGRGTGTSWIDLNKLAPKNELHASTTIVLSRDAEGQSVKIKMVEKTDAKVEPKK